MPIVVIGAPFGAWFIKHRSRLFFSSLLYVAIALQSVAAVLIVPLSAGRSLPLDGGAAPDPQPSSDVRAKRNVRV